MATDLSASAIGGVGDSAAGASGGPENAYEKLSREVHQMQITGAIHTDWLENPKGFLLKPDFKRKAQHVGAGGKKLNSSRLLRLHLPGNTYRVRWFVLDGMILRYFKTSTEEQELGAIHLTSVNAVLPSSVADAPEHALDLVCADRIYTVAGNDREDMLRGEYKPKLMLRPESAIIRGSSVIPRPSAVARKTAMTQASRFTDANGMRMTGTLTGGIGDGDPKSQGDDDVKEKIITVTFDQPGPLNLILRGTVDDEVMVCGFQDGSGPGGELGPAEASGVIRVGDLLISINNHYFTNIEFQQAVDLIRAAGRPLTLRFSRVDFHTAPPADTTRVAEGWVLSKEPSAHRYRVRMLQLHGDKLKLYKPSMQGGRVDEPCLVIRMEQVTDIRPTNDTREVVTAFTQCHPKQWGVTLEGSQSIFTFYTKNREDMVQWVDLLKNSPLFSPKATRLSIPVHPVAVVEFDPVLEPKVVLQDDVGKLGDLLSTFSCHYFLLLEDGKMLYYVNADSAATRMRPIGTLRCDNIVSIVPSQVTDDTIGGDDSNSETSSNGGVTEEMMPWRLELGILVQGSAQKYRRPFIMCFASQEKMMKWGIAIGKEAKRLTGQEYDLSSISRRASRSNSQTYAPRHSETPMTRPTISRLISNPTKYIDPNVQEYSRLYRSLKDVTVKAATRGWFFVKKPRSVGLGAYHPRFLVLIDYQLMLFKYEVLEEESLHSYASMLDLRNIKDVREADSGFQENLDFTIQLTTADDIIWMLVAESYAQKEAWLSALIWLSDYYYRPGDNDDDITPAITDAKRIALNTAGIMMSIPETEGSNSITSQDIDPKEADRLAAAGIAKERLSTTGLGALLTDDFTGIGGEIQIAGKKVFAAISSGVFRYYASQSDYESEWGDAIDAISLKEIEEVHSDGLDLGSFVVKVKGEKEKAPHAEYWASTQPKEAWIWKLDRLYQVFRRRYFSLRNHQLIFYTEQGGRMLGMISLPCIFHLQMSKVWTRSKDEADFYQLEVSFAVPTAAEESSRTDQIGDFYAFLLAFDTEEQLKEWAYAIYDCCTNSMSLKGNATLSPLGEIQVLPKELLKTSTFDHSDDAFFKTAGLPIGPTVPSKRPVPDAAVSASEFSSSGWLYYRTSKEERIRLRYFMQWGYELSIYKHEVLADEATAIRYGVIDCRALVDVRFAYINSPENAVELILGSETSVIIIPRTDQEAVMWRNSLLDVKRAYGQLESGKNKEDTFGTGVFISRGSTFSTHKDNEELLRLQIESTVIYSSNLQDWDGRKWIPKYFVLTSSRVLMMSLALHLYDEEPDILGSFSTKDIMEVRACNDKEEAETGNCKSACVITLRPQSSSAGDVIQAVSDRMIVRCDSIDHCLEWMRLLCSSNGKLELKKNAATGYWGSVNRIASLSRHQSFLATAPLSAAIAAANSGSSASTQGGERTRRMTRQDAARKRTSELIMNRKSMMGYP
ncbi:Cell 12A endoglucanase [Phytophthora cinnamomi]|uniref:Cell 12A endoglucanase n=1 Tax=Phytophthora cinnamomi TaxID=4785 RepID=UPI0035596366|nr:Cell 12A endoglucanase [Phytophthora cinnamomi]